MPEQMINYISPRDKMLYGLSAAAVLVILIVARSYNYLLFHLIVELITISFAFTILLLIWCNAPTSALDLAFDFPKNLQVVS